MSKLRKLNDQLVSLSNDLVSLVTSTVEVRGDEFNPIIRAAKPEEVVALRQLPLHATAKALNTAKAKVSDFILQEYVGRRSYIGPEDPLICTEPYGGTQFKISVVSSKPRSRFDAAKCKAYLIEQGVSAKVVAKAWEHATSKPPVGTDYIKVITLKADGTEEDED